MKVIINVAASLDGKIRPQAGALSDDIDYARTYGLRPKVDAILVGSQTVINDDPRLTAKGLGKDFIPIVLDRKGIITKDARIHLRKPIIISGVKRDFSNEIITSDFSWKNIKQILAEKQIETLLVEGGGKVIRSLITERAWDEFYIYYAPAFCGEDLTPLINGPLNEMLKAQVESVQKQGEGFLVKLTPLNN